MKVVAIIGVEFVVFAIVMTLLHNYLEKKETRKDNK